MRKVTGFSEIKRDARQRKPCVRQHAYCQPCRDLVGHGLELDVGSGFFEVRRMRLVFVLAAQGGGMRLG
jgi:hypothetical protein